MNQWKNTSSVISWFKEIPDKSSHSFMMFDIKDFYPSISETLLNEALNFAKSHVRIYKKDIDTILHARKSLLFDNTHVWIKKVGGLFDVTMGAYDGAEVCELVGTYMLSLIAEKYVKNNFGLYRDDGLAIFKNTSGQQNERIKKDIQRIFKSKDLDITIQCNRKTVDYLDVTLNLMDGTFKPYRKPDDETNYIHAESDHPPTIIKQLPIAIEKRISDLSSNEDIFKQSKQYYQDALTKSGHKYQLKYNPSPQSTKNKRNRRRKIIWFNPPFSRTVVTNVGKDFLRLLDLHFPRHDPLHKIFNRNTVKISYGCMPNIQATISSHNKTILNEKEPLVRGDCNCRSNRDECPLGGECTTPNVLYEGVISSNLPDYENKIYKGISEPPFKTRLGNHKKSFNNTKYQSESTLSKEVWRIKNQGGTYKIAWRVIKQHPGFNPVNGKCNLCLSEKLEILEHNETNLLNKRSEIVSTCRHRHKYMLSSISNVT